MDKEDYLVIQKWMLKELNLKGNELTIFAIVYSFSRDGESEYYGSSKYLSEWTGATKKTVLLALKSLVDKELLIKHEETRSNIKFCTYRCNFDMVDEIRRNYTSGVEITLGGVNSTLGRSENYSGGGVKITPNNIYNNKEDNKENNKGVPTSKLTFIPPTKDEIRAYCQEKNYVDLNVENFYNYYDALDWHLANGKKMKNWKASIATWVGNNYQTKRINKPKLGIDGLPMGSSNTNSWRF